MAPLPAPSLCLAYIFDIKNLIHTIFKSWEVKRQLPHKFVVPLFISGCLGENWGINNFRSFEQKTQRNDEFENHKNSPWCGWNSGEISHPQSNNYPDPNCKNINTLYWCFIHTQFTLLMILLWDILAGSALCCLFSVGIFGVNLSYGSPALYCCSSWLFYTISEEISNLSHYGWYFWSFLRHSISYSTGLRNWDFFNHPWGHLFDHHHPQYGLQYASINKCTTIWGISIPDF